MNHASTENSKEPFTGNQILNHSADETFSAEKNMPIRAVESSLVLTAVTVLSLFFADECCVYKSIE